jgi:hypothetical protein
MSLGTKTSSRVQGLDFDLVGTSWKVVAREVHGTAGATCCQVYPLQGVHRFKSPQHSQIWVSACSLLSSRRIYLMSWWLI